MATSNLPVWNEETGHDVFSLMKVTFPLIFSSQLSVILMFPHILLETGGACPQA